jgi:hypothetical protein
VRGRHGAVNDDAQNTGSDERVPSDDCQGSMMRVIMALAAPHFTDADWSDACNVTWTDVCAVLNSAPCTVLFPDWVAAATCEVLVKRFSSRCLVPLVRLAYRAVDKLLQAATRKDAEDAIRLFDAATMQLTAPPTVQPTVPPVTASGVDVRVETMELACLTLQKFGLETYATHGVDDARRMFFLGLRLVRYLVGVVERRAVTDVSAFYIAAGKLAVVAVRLLHQATETAEVRKQHVPCSGTVQLFQALVLHEQFRTLLRDAGAMQVAVAHAGVDGASLDPLGLLLTFMPENERRVVLEPTSDALLRKFVDFRQAPHAQSPSTVANTASRMLAERALSKEVAARTAALVDDLARRTAERDEHYRRACEAEANMYEAEAKMHALEAEMHKVQARARRAEDRAQRVEDEKRQVEARMHRIEDQVQDLGCHVLEAEERAEEAEEKVREFQDKVRVAENRAAGAEDRAARAEDKVRKAKSRANVFKAMAQQAEAQAAPSRHGRAAQRPHAEVPPTADYVCGLLAGVFDVASQKVKEAEAKTTAMRKYVGMVHEKLEQVVRM